MYLEPIFTLSCWSVGLLYFVQFRTALKFERPAYGWFFFLISAFMTASGLAIWLI